MSSYLRVCVVVLAGFLIAPALARAESPIGCAKQAGGGGKVVKIVAPLDLELDNGTRIALAEIGAPRPDKDHPGTDITSAALAHEALGRVVRLYFDGDESDRHGRALAQVFVEGAPDPWLQRMLISEGAAYVDTWPTNRACGAALLDAEAAARMAARGLWAGPAGRILSADDASEGEGRFAIIQASVVSVTRLRNPSRIYIDFGPDWHSDFTVRIEAKAARLFDSARLDPRDWQDKTIRVRGYVGWRFGPEIEVTNPEQIELVTDAPAN